MKALKNSHTEKVEILHESSVYTIEPGEMSIFLKSQYPVYEKFLDTFGFLVTVRLSEKRKGEIREEYNIPEPKEEEEKKVEEEEKENGTKLAEPKAKSKPRNISRSQKEDADFAQQNVDGVSSGVNKEEKLAGQKQTITYDRDGVGWYGPGVEDDNTVDMSALRQKGPGKF